MSKHTSFKCSKIASPLEPVGKVTWPFSSRYYKFTSFSGLRYLKAVQDKDLPPSLHYIRYIAEVPLSAMTTHEEDDISSDGTGELLRIVICMSMESSRRLLAAQYLQSDSCRVSWAWNWWIRTKCKDWSVGLRFFHAGWTLSYHSITSLDLLSCIPQSSDGGCASVCIPTNWGNCQTRHWWTFEMASPSCSSTKWTGWHSAVGRRSAWRSG